VKVEGKVQEIPVGERERFPNLSSNLGCSLFEG
jgi:hypothetical protein